MVFPVVGHQITKGNIMRCEQKERVVEPRVSLKASSSVYDTEAWVRPWGCYGAGELGPTTADGVALSTQRSLLFSHLKRCQREKHHEQVDHVAVEMRQVNLRQPKTQVAQGKQNPHQAQTQRLTVD